jgi:hypothetical protein
MELSHNEIKNLREILRKSIGDYSDQFTDQEVYELGVTLLQTTAVVLKTRYQTKLRGNGRRTS